MRRSRRPASASTTTLDVLAENIGDNPNAVTRFVLVSRARPSRCPHPPAPTRPASSPSSPTTAPARCSSCSSSSRPGASTCSCSHSRPIGDALGRYRFVIDLDGHIDDERVADALLGVRRFSPRVLFLGSYPRADGRPVAAAEEHDDEVYAEARAWLGSLRSR